MEFIPFFFKNNQSNFWHKHRPFSKNKSMKFFIVLMILVGPTSLLWAEEAHLTWNPSPDADVVGYKIYYGTESGQYSESIDVGNTSSHTLSVSTPGLHYFAVTAYKVGHYESGFSNEVSKEMTGAPSSSDGGGSVNVTSSLDGGGSANVTSSSDGKGAGGGGCVLRLPLQREASPLDAAEMPALIAVILFLAVEKILHPLLPLRIQRRQRTIL
jgi:hypothetical protein